jgi:hypothetical protein
MEEWSVLKEALVSFNYFKGWTEEIMRECCILSKIYTFKRNTVNIFIFNVQCSHVLFN